MISAPAVDINTVMTFMPELRDECTATCGRQYQTNQPGGTKASGTNMLMLHCLFKNTLMVMLNNITYVFYAK